MQVYEKYVSLARDASSSGDRIAAESYHQYAEHYYRILNDSTDPQRPQQPQPAQASQPAQRAHPEPARAAPQPYPLDAEQPVVDVAAMSPQLDGNGPAAEAKPAADGSGEPPAGDGESKSGAMDGEETKRHGRGRGRPKPRAGNGAAKDAPDGAGGSPEHSTDEPVEKDGADA